MAAPSLRDSALFGSRMPAPPRPVRAASAARVCCQAQPEQAQVARRSALGLLAGAAVLPLVALPPAGQAAYGDAARVFGKAPASTGYTPYQGSGYSLLIPSKWAPNKERSSRDVVFRYEDNGFAVNNVEILSTKAGKNSITDFGSPPEFLSTINQLFGKNVWQGETISEGGFAKNQVSGASLLAADVKKGANGKPYFIYDVLTRTADGSEGGKHQLISASVGSDGNLWICKAQIGEKRWVASGKDGKKIQESFTVA